MRSSEITSQVSLLFLGGAFIFFLFQPFLGKTVPVDFWKGFKPPPSVSVSVSKWQSGAFVFALLLH